MRSLIALLLGIMLPGAQADEPGVLDELIALQLGSFSSAVQSRQDQRYDEVIWHIAEIWPHKEDGARWIYTEAWLPEASAPYMQRIASYVLDGDGSVISTRHALPDAARFIGAWQTPERFDALDASSLAALPGCETVMVRTGPQRFEGGTVGRRCENRHRGAAYAVSRTVLSADSMSNWDRGFAADGTLVWGPAAGGYQFRRLDADNSCVDPVRLLVYGEVLNREQFLPYALALAESGLYPAHEGYYEATTPPLAVLEGEPPAGRGVIIARFPCLDAARRFWDSPGYTEIRKLRTGVASFEVMVLPAVPFPDDREPLP